MGTAMYLQHAEAPTKLIAQLAVGSDALPHCLKLDPCNSAKRIAGPETDWQAGTWGPFDPARARGSREQHQSREVNGRNDNLSDIIQSSPAIFLTDLERSRYQISPFRVSFPDALEFVLTSGMDGLDPNIGLRLCMLVCVSSSALNTKSSSPATPSNKL